MELVLSETPKTGFPGDEAHMLKLMGKKILTISCSNFVYFDLWNNTNQISSCLQNNSDLYREIFAFGFSVPMETAGQY